MKSIEKLEEALMKCSRVKLDKPRELPRYGTGALHDEQQFCFDKGHKEAGKNLRNKIREILREYEVIM